MYYKVTDDNLVINVPDLESATAVNSGGKYYILFILKDNSTEEWEYNSSHERDKDLQNIFDLQIALQSHRVRDNPRNSSK